MPVSSSGPIKFSDIRNELGLINNIKMSTMQNLAFSYSLTNKININTFRGYSGLPIIIENNINKQPILISGKIYYYLFTSTTGTNTINFKKNTVCEILLVGGGGNYIYNGGSDSFNEFYAVGGAGNVYYNNLYNFNKGIYNISIGINGINIFINSGISRYDMDYFQNINGENTTISYNNSIILQANGGTYPYRNGYYIKGGNSQLRTIINGIDSGSIIYNGTDYADTTGIMTFSGAGANGNATVSNGGNGYLSSITGIPTYYAGGGGANNGSGANYYGGSSISNNYNGCVIIRFTL